MAAISAQLVKELREKTGAGMMDCKKALVESDGDVEKAVEFLRKKGLDTAKKRAGRATSEGTIQSYIHMGAKLGVMVEVSCETDFVAKNEDFVNFAKKIAEIALKKLPENLEALNALSYADGLSIGEKVTEQIGVIGEKLEVSHYSKIVTAAGEGQVLPYIHMGYKAGVLVALNLEGPEYIEPGKNVAMQVAAMRPVALDKNGVDAKTVAKEIEIGKEQARKDGKPEAMLEKIAMGKLNKFYKENTLLAQAYVRDNKMSVEGYLKSLHKDLTVTAFKHAELG